MSLTELTGGRHGRAVLALGLAGALALAACGGSSSPSPSTGSGASSAPTQEPSATQEPTTTEAPGSSTAGGGGADGSVAFSAATSALDALDSYSFKVEIQSVSVDGSDTTTDHTLLSGAVFNKPTAASSLDNQSLDPDGTISSETAIVVIGSDAWIRDGDSTQPWVAEPAVAAGAVVQMMVGFRPEKIFGTYFAALGGDFNAVGTETKNGVQATHYKGNDQIGTILGALAGGVQGTWTSDVWIATDGGYLVHSEASASGSDATTSSGSFSVTVDITDINSAPAITPPSTN
jgi:drug/metabolite transporter superfamily protein YnfA